MWRGRLFNCGANVLTRLDCDHAFCSFWCPASDWAEAFELMLNALIDPKWQQKEFEKARKQLLTDAQNASKQLSTCFQDALTDYLYPAPHPYSLPSKKVSDDLSQIQRSDLKDALGLLSQQNLVLVVSGPREQEVGIIAQLKRQVARLPLQPSKPWMTTSSAVSQRISHAHTEFDAPQTTVRVIFPPILVTDPDFFAKTIAFSLLVGPSRYSLLGRELRIKRGLVYSFGAGKYNTQFAPYSFMELHTSKEAETLKALTECCEHCKNMVFRQDFERAQNHMVDSWLGATRSVEDYTQCVAQMRERGLSLDEAQNIFQKYKEVTYEQVRRVLPSLCEIRGYVSIGRNDA